MKINVHIKDKMFTVPCGDGEQRIRWLGDVAIFRYEHFYSPINGTTKGVRFENGTILNMEDMIQDRMKDDVHVWIILKEDLEALGMENEIKKSKTILDDDVYSRPQTSDFRIRPGTSLSKQQRKF